MILIILLLISMNINIYNCKNYEYTKLRDFTKTNFELNNVYYIFEYTDIAKKNYFGGGHIYFVFDNGYKSSTTIYIYNSYDQIEKGEIGFINYIHNTSLTETKYFAIDTSDDFYKIGQTYYLVLFDIANTYKDSIFVVNDIDYLPLNEYNNIIYTHYFEKQFNFNFYIPKNTKGYLHYQTAKCALNPLGMSDAYYIRIKDDKEGVYYDKQTCGVNGYVELNPELTYYIQIAILKKPLENAIFMLSLVDYGPNYNLKEEAIELIALSPQHFTIFKNISNLSINESFAFNIELNSGFAADTYLLIKNYESCDFEKIYKSCPSKIEMFDYQIDTPYGTRKYEITKKNNFTNGILLGVFFVQNYVQMGTTTIKIYESNNNENDSDSDKSDSDESESSKSDNNDNDDDGLSGGAIFGIIVANLFVLGLICFCCSKCNENNDDKICIIAIFSSE